MSVTVGSSAFGRAWWRRIRPSRRPIAAGGRDVVLGQRLDDRRAHDDRVLADEPERDRRERQGEVGEEVDEAVEMPVYFAPAVEHAERREPAEAPVAKISSRAMPSRKYGVE